MKWICLVCPFWCAKSWPRGRVVCPGWEPRRPCVYVCLHVSSRTDAHVCTPGFAECAAVHSQAQTVGYLSQFFLYRLGRGRRGQCELPWRGLPLRWWNGHRLRPDMRRLAATQYPLPSGWKMDPTAGRDETQFRPCLCFLNFYCLEPPNRFVLIIFW